MIAVIALFVGIVIGMVVTSLAAVNKLRETSEEGRVAAELSGELLLNAERRGTARGAAAERERWKKAISKTGRAMGKPAPDTEEVSGSGWDSK